MRILDAAIFMHALDAVIFVHILGAVTFMHTLDAVMFIRCRTIPTHMRLITGSGISRFNIPYYIRKHVMQKAFDRLAYLKLEYEYIELVSKLINKLENNYKIIFKVSPFEDPKIYKKTFPNQEIHEGHDVRDFLKNVDVVLNVYSSISVDTLKFNVPVINLSKLIKWDEYILKNAPRPSHPLLTIQLSWY